jgi:hypothetical protein
LSRTLVMLCMILFLPACRLPSSGEKIVGSPEEEIVQTFTQVITASVTPSYVPLPTSTDTPPVILPETVPIERLINRLCPQVSLPAGLFDFREQYSDPIAADPTVYEVYQLVALLPTAEPEFCKLRIHPFHIRDLKFSGDSLFWQAYDSDQEQVMVWQYDPLDQLEDDVDPVHVPLNFTALDQPADATNLVSFVVSADGSEIAWSKTEPRQDDAGNFFFLQEIYYGAIEGENSTLLWKDALQGDYPHIIRLRELSAETETLYYSDEPIGLGTSYPGPVGKYSSLYSIPTWGEIPTLHHDCGMEHWCISDFAIDFDLLAAIQEDTLRLISLDGVLQAELEPPGETNVLRQAVIGPDGSIVFLALQMGEADFFAEPMMVSLFHWAPPFTEEPRLVLSEPGLRNILGWVSADILATDILFSSSATGEDNEIAFINLVSITDSAMDMSVYPTNYFLDLIP